MSYVPEATEGGGDIMRARLRARANYVLFPRSVVLEVSRGPG